MEFSAVFLTSLPVESIQASFGYLVTREHVKDLHKLMIVAEKPEAANEWIEKTLQIGIETIVVQFCGRNRTTIRSCERPELT